MYVPCLSLGWLLQVPAAAAAAAPLGAPAAEGCDAPGTCSPGQQRLSFQERWIFLKTSLRSPLSWEDHSPPLQPILPAPPFFSFLPSPPPYSQRLNTLYSQCHINTWWTGAPSKEASRAISRSLRSRAGHRCHSCMRRSWPPSWCHRGGEAGRRGEGTVLRARGSRGSTSASLLQVPHQAPACLVQRCCHKSRVHGKSSNVESSHPGHWVACRLASSWEGKCSDRLPPRGKAGGLEWWMCNQSTALCIFEVVQTLHSWVAAIDPRVRLQYDVNVRWE